MKHLHGFTCPDCGQRILSYSWDDEDQRCASCDWIRKNVPPQQQGDARERLGVPLAADKARK